MISPVVLTVLRIVLTAGLIILFLIIMYRRLLRKMKMRIPTDRFALLLAAELSATDRMLTLRFEMPVRDRVTVQLIDSLGGVQTLFDEEAEKGLQTVSLVLPAMASGPFTVRFITSNHRTDRVLDA